MGCKQWPCVIELVSPCPLKQRKWSCYTLFSAKYTVYTSECARRQASSPIREPGTCCTLPGIRSHRRRRTYRRRLLCQQLTRIERQSGSRRVFRGCFGSMWGGGTLEEARRTLMKFSRGRHTGGSSHPLGVCCAR